jgi:hypothetical protein
MRVHWVITQKLSSYFVIESRYIHCVQNIPFLTLHLATNAISALVSKLKLKGMIWH